MDSLGWYPAIVRVTGPEYVRHMENAHKEQCYEFELDEDHNSTESVIREFITNPRDATLALETVKWAQAKGATHIILRRHRQTGAVLVQCFELVS